MKVRTWSAIVLTSLCGCRMCQDPWDYSGPVQGAPAIPYAATTTRSGSALNGGPGLASSPTAAPNMPAPPATPKAPAETEPDGPLTMKPNTSTLRR